MDNEYDNTADTEVDRAADELAGRYMRLLAEIDGNVGNVGETSAFLRQTFAPEVAAFRARAGDAWVDALARAIGRMITRRDRVQRRRDLLVAEYDQEIEPLTYTAGFLSSLIAEEVVRLRVETREAVKSINVPGVGRWQSRTRAGGYRVESEASLREWLLDDERKEWGEAYIKREPKVDTAAFREDAEKVIAAAGGELPPGVVKVEDGVEVTPPVKGI